ncbi:MAG: hypothetical protein PUP92_38880, partial [Rhizonema sp. PD38]|nr:hypothetical protein [Rhizonema sp. PD38]
QTKPGVITEFVAWAFRVTTTKENEDMSFQAKSTQKSFSNSKIKIEVKEISQPKLSKNTASHLNSDADGGDLTNE